jgi:peptide/nickel transport system ATP-binding protein
MPYTAGLLGSIPALDSAGAPLHPITGAPPSLINLPPGCPFSPRCPLATEICQREEPPLGPTDLPHHEAACHHWETLSEVADPTLLFRSEAQV